MGAPRTDYRATPPRDRFGTPGTQYPTPNVEDLIVVEEKAITTTGYAPILYGSPRNGDATMKLVWQGPIKLGNNELVHRMIWAKGRAGQEAYNAALNYTSDNISYPIYIRRSLELRSSFAPSTKGAAYTGLVGVTLTAGGTGYPNSAAGASVLSYGGAGTGATYTAEVQGGVVVALLLTNGGTGYTSAPTVIVSGVPHTTATFTIQPTNNSHVTVGNRIYRFRDTLASEDDVKIGATLILSIANLNMAIMLSGTSGVNYQIAGVANADFSSTVSDAVLSLTRKATSFGSVSGDVAGMSAIPNGSGATATAAIQPPTALLTNEEAVPADGELASLFLWVTRVYRTLPGPVIARQEIDAETQTPVSITIQEVVKPAGGASTSSFAIGTGPKAFITQASLPFIDGTRVRAIGASALNYMEGTVTYSGTTLTMTVDQTGGSGTLAAWTFQFVGYAQLAGSVITYEPINDVYGREVTATLVGYGSLSRVVDDYVMFNMPRLITNATVSTAVSRSGATRRLINWIGPGPAVARASQSVLTKIQTTITYHASKAAADSAAPAIEYAPVFNDLFYDGIFYNLNERNVLNDALTFTAISTSAANPTWGASTEGAVTFAASVPSATDYAAWIGSARRIAVDIKPWKYDLWRMEVRKAVLR